MRDSTKAAAGGIAWSLAIATAAAFALAAGLASCGAEADVVGAKAPLSFASALAAVSPVAEGGAWKYVLPDGERFAVSRAAGPGSLEVSLDAAPFLAAGLKESELRAGPVRVAGGRLAVRGDLPALDAGAALGKPEDAIALVAAKERSRLGWHEALDHYGIPLVKGVMVEWARDRAVNDKDFVFVLDPALLPGVDPARVQGWKYADVDVKDEAGNPVKVKRLLKPYELGS